MKKKISLLTIGFVIIAAVLAILALFKFVPLKGVVSDIFWTSVTLTAVGLLTLNSADMIGRKNKLALTSLGFLLASALLVIISFWFPPSSLTYVHITIIMCILSVLFNIVTSNILKLGSSYKVIQICSYISFTLVAAFLIAVVLDAGIIVKEIRLFLVLVVLSLVGLCLLSVFSKKQGVKESSNSNEPKYVRLSVEDYEELVAAKMQLEEILANKDDQLSK